MSPTKARFITLSQRTLVIGAVLAVLGPAAEVISLDVVPDGPDAQPASSAVVETVPIAPEVTEVPLQAAAVAARAAGDLAGAVRGLTSSAVAHGRAFVSPPQDVSGYGAIGLTWDRGVALGEDQAIVQARTRTDGVWSDWSTVTYEPEEGPDADSAEGRSTRPGTDPLVIGDVDQVQTRITTTAVRVPQGLRMAVIAPGQGKTTTQAPALRNVASGTSTPKPYIFSRSQWGADESLRKSAPSYGEIHAGFVHHTVNANDYSTSQVPGILRSIYAYHTQSRGWSDIGYNFLVDRFGRIWEGRYGGIDRPVVGAHTEGYNSNGFGASAIGDYEKVQPSQAVLDAYGKLMAWKLSLHGVKASSTSQQVGSGNFAAISGHRDTKSTACPGRYLYAKLPTIRSIASSLQADWTGRDRDTDLAGNALPDLLVRRASDKALFVLPTGGMLGFRAPRTVGTGYSGYDVVTLTPDLTGDGRSDLFLRYGATGQAAVRPGREDGTFGGSVRSTAYFKGYDLVTPVGDLNGDGRNDFVGRPKGTIELYLIRNTGTSWARTKISSNWPYNRTSGTLDLTGDRIPDLVARDANGKLWLIRGTDAGVGTRSEVGGSWSNFDQVSGFSDWTKDGLRDIVARTSTGDLFVYPGRGNGQFRHRIGPISGFGNLRALSGGNTVGSADADVLAVNGDNLVLFQHKGTQNTSRPVFSGLKLTDVNQVHNAGDWDRDGSGDLLTRTTGGVLQLRRGLGTGRFADPVTINGNFGDKTLVAPVGDVTGDGYPDLMAQPSGGSMRIFPGRGTSALGVSYVVNSAVTAHEQLGLGRWNSDGAPDSAFRSGGELSWRPGNGPGGLEATTVKFNLDLTPYNWVIAAGDVDRNGRPDLVVRDKATGRLWLVPGSTSGGFGARRFLVEGYAGYDLAD